MDIKQAHVAQDWTYDRPAVPFGSRPMVSKRRLVRRIPRCSDESDNGEKVVKKGHESWVHALRYSADGKVAVSGGCDGRLIWWSIPGGGNRIGDSHHRCSCGLIRAIDISPDGSRLVSVGNDLMIRLWDLATEKKVAEWGGHEKHIYSVLFHFDGQHLLTVTWVERFICGMWRTNSW